MSYAAALWFAAGDELAAETGDGTDVAHMSDDFVFQTFHLSRAALTFTVDWLRARLGGSRAVDSQLLAALSFYANGCARPDVTAAALSRARLSHALTIVSRVLSESAAEFITFPRSPEDRRRVAREVERRVGLPRVVGALGCLHTRVRPVARHHALYRNPLGYLSVMSQVICDSDCNLLSVENLWPGSTAEQSIWERSAVCQRFRSGKYGDSWLVGANCYSLSKHVLTPLTYAVNHSGLLYNEAHSKMQKILQHTFHALKTRFCCLDNLGDVEQFAPLTPSHIINACCVLHNIAKKFSVPLPVEFVPEMIPREVRSKEVKVTDHNLLLIRENLIRTCFSQESTVAEQSEEG